MPGPQSVTIKLSAQQQEILARLQRKDSCPQGLLARIQIVQRAAQGQPNVQIARELHHQRPMVILWRQRWAAAAPGLAQAEAAGVTARCLEELIVAVLQDAPRPGAPGKFTAEEIVQIVALACEPPPATCPVTHWTPQELRLEVLRRGLVSAISVRTVGRFLKRNRPPTAAESVLAECATDRPGGL